MSGNPDIPAETRDRIFGAVQAELLHSGIDGFSVERVARRAGVEPSLIRRHWHDRRVLLMDVMLARTTESTWNPDTGSVYTDLEAVAAVAVENSQTATGRALIRRVLPNADDADLAQIGMDLWAARFRDAAQILQRAADRGQLRDGVAADEAIRMFAAAFYYDIIFTDSPVRPEYGDQVVDIFLHGVLGAAGRDRPWNDVYRLAGQDHEGQDGPALADHAVEAARRAVVLMRVWADALPDPVVLYEAVRDDGGRIVDFVCRDLNRATCEEVGMTRSDLLGRRLLETLPIFASSGLLERYANCVSGGEPLVLNDFRYTHFDQERHLDLRATSAGAELITVTWRDVGDRVEASRLDQRYRKLMDSSAVPAGLTTPEGRFVSVNQAMASMIGYDIDTMLTMSWQDLTVPEVLQNELEAIADLLAGRRSSFHTVKQILHADGRRIWGDLSVSCIRRSDGEAENLIAQVVDVTEFIDAIGAERAALLIAEREQRGREPGPC